MRYEAHVVRSFVRALLERPLERRWVVYERGLLGTVLLRSALPDDMQIHVWGECYALDYDDLIHSHDHGFTSMVVAGTLRQWRYVEYPEGRPYLRTTSDTKAIAAREILQTTPVWLKRCPVELYVAGDTYEQRADEIHATAPEPGTVTIRHRPGHAVQDYVYAREHSDFWSPALRVPYISGLADERTVMAMTRAALAKL